VVRSGGAPGRYQTAAELDTFVASSVRVPDLSSITTLLEEAVDLSYDRLLMNE
jgi:hypothetical protein